MLGLISLFSFLLGAIIVFAFFTLPNRKRTVVYGAYFMMLWFILCGLYIGTHP